jgi:hypothetical protein
MHELWNSAVLLHFITYQPSPSSERWLINELVSQANKVPTSPATFFQHLSPRALVTELSPFRLPYSFLHQTSVNSSCFILAQYKRGKTAVHITNWQFYIVIFHNSGNTKRCTALQSRYYLCYLASTCFGKKCRHLQGTK